MLSIIPSILTDSKDELKSLLYTSSLAVDRVHIDIIDGQYANNKTITPEDVQNTKTKLAIEFHLMVEDILAWAERSVKVGACTVTAQIESMKSQREYVYFLKKAEKKVGLALDLKTSVDRIDHALLVDIDSLLIMSVAAGFGGQKFDKSAIEKIAYFTRIKNNYGYNFDIVDDGGITFENIDDIHYYGVNSVVVGRRLFEGNIKSNIDKYYEAAHNVELMKR